MDRPWPGALLRLLGLHDPPDGLHRGLWRPLQARLRDPDHRQMAHPRLRPGHHHLCCLVALLVFGIIRCTNSPTSSAATHASRGSPSAGAWPVLFFIFRPVDDVPVPGGGGSGNHTNEGAWSRRPSAGWMDGLSHGTLRVLCEGLRPPAAHRRHALPSPHRGRAQQAPPHLRRPDQCRLQAAAGRPRRGLQPPMIAGKPVTMEDPRRWRRSPSRGRQDRGFHTEGDADFATCTGVRLLPEPVPCLEHRVAALPRCSS